MDSRLVSLAVSELGECLRVHGNLLATAEVVHRRPAGQHPDRHSRQLRLVRRFRGRLFQCGQGAAAGRGPGPAQGTRRGLRARGPGHGPRRAQDSGRGRVRGHFRHRRPPPAALRANPSAPSGWPGPGRLAPVPASTHSPAPASPSRPRPSWPPSTACSASAGEGGDSAKQFRRAGTP